MFIKTYPPVIVVRKWLVGAAVFILLAVACFVMLQLSQINHPISENDATDAAAVKRMAQPHDLQWVNTQVVKPTPKVETATGQSVTASKDQIIDSAPVSTTLPPPTEEMTKAMSAPINSNQLIGQAQVEQTQDISNNISQESMNQTSTINTSAQSSHTNQTAFLKHNQMVGSDYLSSQLHNPVSPYEVQAGTVIPGVLLTGINSDLPGQITAQVRANVYDSVTGNHLLIPQGAKLTGAYDAQIVYGQSRVLVAWHRIIYPNGQSINLQGMPGIDLSGYAGFKDKTNHHYVKLFGSVLMMSVLGAGLQLSQPQQNNNPYATPTVGQTIAQSVGNNLAEAGVQLMQKNLAVQPTIEIRPGYLFNVTVTKDMVFAQPYLQDRGE